MTQHRACCCGDVPLGPWWIKMQRGGASPGPCPTAPATLYFPATLHPYFDPNDPNPSDISHPFWTTACKYLPGPECYSMLIFGQAFQYTGNYCTEQPIPPGHRCTVSGADLQFFDNYDFATYGQDAYVANMYECEGFPIGLTTTCPASLTMTASNIVIVGGNPYGCNIDPTAGVVQNTSVFPGSVSWSETWGPPDPENFICISDPGPPEAGPTLDGAEIQYRHCDTDYYRFGQPQSPYVTLPGGHWFAAITINAQDQDELNLRWWAPFTGGCPPGSGWTYLPLSGPGVEATSADLSVT